MKKKDNVLGYQFSCVNYEPCPLCYGCRAYDASYVKCSKCAEDFKRSICNKERHTDKALSRMIRRPVVHV